MFNNPQEKVPAGISPVRQREALHRKAGKLSPAVFFEQRAGY
jgi:hypothetical protein